jgi:AcrR family transcriptional regulator
MMEGTEKIGPSQKILMTAFECLSTRGYANVSMRNIADEAGVALSQLTYYYKSKEKLFTEVVNMMMRQYMHEIKNSFQSAANKEERMAALIGYFKALIREKPELLKLFIDFTAQSLWLPPFRKQVEGFFNDLVEIVDSNILNGEDIVGYSSRSVARFILGALYGTSIQIMLDSDENSALESLNLTESILLNQGDVGSGLKC